MSRRQWGALPLGELHDEGVCALCGSRGEWPKLKRTILLSTHAHAHVCSDVVACIRRRRKARVD